MQRYKYYWDFDGSPELSTILCGTPEFGKAPKIYLVDQYGAKSPYLVDNEFLSTGCRVTKLLPLVLFDSNLIDAAIRRKRGVIDNDFEKLLFYMIRKGCHSDILFYYLENYSKSNTENFEINARKATEAWLHIYLMNKEAFLKDRKVIIDQDELEIYCQKHGVGSLDSLVCRLVNKFQLEYSNNSPEESICMIEACLLKMVLIEKFIMPKADLSAKLDAFYCFLVEELDCLMVKEVFLALHYFSGMAGKFLGIEKSTSFESAMSTIGSTSWDIFLTRCPELFMKERDGYFFVPYFATRERKLAEFASLFQVGRIYVSMDGRTYPNYSFRNMELSPSELREVDSVLEKWGKNPRIDHPIEVNYELLQKLRLELQSKLEAS